MRHFLFIIMAIILLLGVNQCKLLTYNYGEQPLTTEEKNTIIVQDSIKALLKKEFSIRYRPYSYSQLTTNKPKEFLTLDSLYKSRKQLTKQNEYEQSLQKINEEIKQQIQEINNKKLYHSYQMTHIYLVKNADKNNLYEKEFTFLPNFELKETKTLLHTSLSEDETDLFNYFTLQNPLFETPDEQYNHQMDEAVYNRFTHALANETQHKEQLIHTILHIVKHIRKHSDFDEQDITEGLAQRWINEQNAQRYYPKFEALEAIYNDNKQITAYTLNSTDKDRTIRFTFDLNFVITNVSIR